MALAVRASKLERRRALVGWLGLTGALGVVFLGFKALEYYLDIREHLGDVAAITHDVGEREIRNALAVRRAASDKHARVVPEPT